MKPIVVIGAGGHASVVADCLLAAGSDVLGFVDSDPCKQDGRILGLSVIGDDAAITARFKPDEILLANGIGGVRNTKQRKAVQQRFEDLGWEFTSVRHPTAIVSSHAALEGAVQLLAGTIVQASAQIGHGTVVNTGAIIEHDANVGSYVHIAPRALLCGDVVVGDGSHIGAGAIVRQGIVLGPNTLVGAGAVVVGHFAGAGTLLGVPARPLERS